MIDSNVYLLLGWNFPIVIYFVIFWNGSITVILCTYFFVFCSPEGPLPILVLVVRIYTEAKGTSAWTTCPSLSSRPKLKLRRTAAHAGASPPVPDGAARFSFACTKLRNGLEMRTALMAASNCLSHLTSSKRVSPHHFR